MNKKMRKKGQFILLQIIAYTFVFITIGAATLLSFDDKEIFVGGYAHAAVDAELEHSVAKQSLHTIALYSLNEASNNVNIYVDTEDMPTDSETGLFLAKNESIRYYPTLREQLDKLEVPFDQAMNSHITAYNEKIIEEQAFKTEKIVNIEEGLPYYQLPNQGYQLGYSDQDIIVKPIRPVEIIFARPAKVENGIETASHGWNGRYVANSDVRIALDRKLQEKIYPYFSWEKKVNIAYMCMHFELNESFVFDEINEIISFCNTLSDMEIEFDKITTLKIYDDLFVAKQTMFCSNQNTEEKQKTYNTLKEEWTVANLQVNNMQFNSPSIILTSGNKELHFSYRKLVGQPARWMYSLDGNEWIRLQMYSGVDDKREQLRKLVQSDDWNTGINNIATAIKTITGSDNSYDIKINRKKITHAPSSNDILLTLTTENTNAALQEYNRMQSNQKESKKKLQELFKTIPNCDVFKPNLEQPEKIVTEVGQKIIKQHFTQLYNDADTNFDKQTTIAEQLRAFENNRFAEIDFYKLYDAQELLTPTLSKRQTDWLTEPVNRDVLFQELPYEGIQADLNSNSKLDYWEAIYGLHELPKDNWNIGLQLLQ